MKRLNEMESLVGLTLIEVKGCEGGSEEVAFVVEPGLELRMFHYQDCCEHVWLEEVVGDPQDLVGTRICEAYECSSTEAGEKYEGRNDDSGIDEWTFYHIRTTKGTVVLRWLGMSNGYCSVDVTTRWYLNGQGA